MVARFQLGGLCSNGNYIEKNYTALELFLLKYSSKKFLKENTLLSPFWGWLRMRLSCTYFQQIFS
jgi:hypothetical protein